MMMCTGKTSQHHKLEVLGLRCALIKYVHKQAVRLGLKFLIEARLEINKYIYMYTAYCSTSMIGLLQKQQHTKCKQRNTLFSCKMVAQRRSNPQLCAGLCFAADLEASRACLCTYDGKRQDRLQFASNSVCVCLRVCASLACTS
jgi:hypothetical protein